MSRSSLRRSALLATALTVALTTAACTGDAEPDPQPTRSPSASQSGKPTEKPREVTFGAFGTEEEVAAFQSVVDSFNASSTTRRGGPARSGWTGWSASSVTAYDVRVRRSTSASSRRWSRPVVACPDRVWPWFAPPSAVVPSSRLP